MSYYDLLRDPRWQRKRLEILQRADFRCEECGDASSTLHVHHTYYAKGRKPWEYEDESLRSLCETCHAHVTELNAEIQRLVGGMPLMDVQTVLSAVRELATNPTAELMARLVGVESAAQPTYPSPDMCPDCSLRENGLVSYPALREEPAAGMTRCFYRCANGHEWFTDWAPGLRLTAAQIIADMVDLYSLPSE